MIDKINKQLLWVMELLRFNLKSVLEYKAAFLMQVIGMMINNIGLISVWYLFFQIFNDVNGWSFKEMIGLHGFIALIYGITFSLGNGIRKISKNVNYGQLDKYLLLPKNPLLSVIFSETQISAVGDVAFGLVSLTIYFTISNLQIAQLLILPLLVFFVLLVFSGFIICIQSLAFWIPNSEELSDSLFEFLLGPSLYPNSSFVGGIKIFFTFFIPAIVIGGLPINILLGLDISRVFLLTFLGLFWFVLSSLVFNHGLKKYESGNLVGTR